MALHADILVDGLVNLLAQAPWGLGAALQRGPVAPVVAAYDRYAREAQDLGFNPVAQSGAAQMQASLVAHVPCSRDPVAAAATRLDAAHRAYWQGTAFATSFKPSSPQAQVLGGNGRFRAIVGSHVHVGDTRFFAEEVARVLGEPALTEASRAALLAQAWHRATLHVWTEMTGVDTTWPQEQAQVVRAWGCIH